MAIRSIVALLVFVLVPACEIYTDDSPPTVDAGRDEVRAWECKHLCPEALCPGASYAQCEASCLAWPSTIEGYCPMP